ITTLEPGARLVFTHGRDCRPRSTAFLARSPAASITAGLDVLVQLVIAAIATEPWPISNALLFSETATLVSGDAATATLPPVFLFDSRKLGSTFCQACLAFFKGTRS